MDITETLRPRSRKAWRKWLTRNHRKKTEIWVIFFNKATGKQKVSIADAVEEALCFGWIDGTLKKLDHERFALRFSPRRKKSHWSPSNKARALKLLTNRQMRKAGKDKLPKDVLKKWERVRKGP
jgi:uncharacterized protein YdeI (YjbR/CyaY-like superfamily)